jgi:hypothetical protein
MDRNFGVAKRTCQPKMGQEVSISTKASLSLRLDFNSPTTAETIPNVSFWQVATVFYLLLSWKGRFLGKRNPPQKPPLSYDTKLTPEEEAQMIQVFDHYRTTYSYRKCALIGKGASSKVYRAMRELPKSSYPPLLPCANEVVALKEMSLSDSKKYKRSLWLREIKVMRKLDH